MNTLSTEEFIHALHGRDVRLWLDGQDLRCSAPKGILTAELRDELKRRKADILNLLEQGDLNTPPRLGPMTPEQAQAGRFPLSFAQERLWFLQQFYTNVSIYHIQMTTPLMYDVDTVQAALRDLVARHAILRTRYELQDQGPVQIVDDAQTAPVRVVDLSGLLEDEYRAALSRYEMEETQAPFNLATGPVWRAALLKPRADRSDLVFTVHHIATDGFSMQLIQEELLELCRAHASKTSPELRALPIQYVDYALWHRQWLDAQRLKKQLEYWKQRLDGIPPTIELPTDRPRPSIPTYKAAACAGSIDGAVVSALRALARRTQATLFMTMLAAFKVLLARYAHQTDIVVGTPIAGRDHAGTERIVGLFLNTLVFRTDLSGNPTFAILLARVRDAALDAYRHQDLPFEKLVEAVQPVRDASRNPLFQVMFTFLVPMTERTAGVVGEMDTAGTAGAQVDLAMYVQEHEDRLDVGLTYSTDLFDASTTQRMLRHYLRLLQAVAANPEAGIGQLPMLEDVERRQLLLDWNRTDRRFLEEPVSRLFERQVARRPRTPALAFEGAALTYAELNARANRLARHLCRFGVGRDVVVAICLERGLDMVVAVLAVLKAGAAYVPLDPAYSDERLAFMLEDSEAAVVLTARALAAKMNVNSARLVCVDTDASELAVTDDTNLSVAPGVDDLAYVIYTSGSTGKPKGVMIHHRALSNFLQSMVHEPGMNENDVLLAVTTLSFDIAGLELFLPLTTGAQIVLPSRAAAADGRALLTLLDANRVTVLQATPATWRLLLTAGWEGSPALTILCGGEALTRELADALLPRCATLWNVYGPTETTVWSTAQLVVAGHGPVPIGRPIANTQIYITDDSLEPVPVNVVGQMHIGGSGVARGYWRRPELTLERFIPDPFSAKSGARLYKTGDLARWLADGTIEYLGRDDLQVKIRGYRIELGEVEAKLAEQAGVREAVVMAREDAPGDKRLVAYYTGTAQPEELRAQALTALPAYMVPAAYVKLEALPLLINGKLDRRALPAPADTAYVRQSYEAPQAGAEETLAWLWADLLKLERVGRHDNFFALGGHSLLAMQLVSRVRDSFEVELPVVRVFETQSLMELAAVITHAMLDNLEQLSDEQAEQLLREMS